ncbi:MAG: hypothetical protein LC135_10810 [Phycisphaerae bacterium]|nr:hypothetical protein [Phycisphaerae bacterium]MCZ2400340.1 hypothetical protein [Phycisphaerae bacterium]
MSIAYERLATPRRSLGILIEPHPHELLAALRDAAAPQAAVLGRPARAWRAELRQALGLGGPLVVTGHQAEFFHAGVFAKNIAADILAERAGAPAALFLLVDSDTPKTAHLALPAHAAGELRRATLSIPGCDPRLPVEFHAASPEDWDRFFGEIRRHMAGADLRVLDVLTSAWVAPTLADALAVALPEIERGLGLRGARVVRVSRLSETAAFRAFAAHLLLNAEALAHAYNTAQVTFRLRHRLRNPSRPVPPLEVNQGAVETPFWLINERGDRRRQRLFVRPTGGAIEVLADRTPIALLERDHLADPAWHAAPWPLAHAHWRLRPRALALSCFARLMLADLFIHGIGGAKYDEVTDDFAQRLFGEPLPPYACVTATLHLPGADAAAPSAVEIHRARRDLHWNPQRHLRTIPADLAARRRQAVEASRRLRERSPSAHAARRGVFNEIRALNEQMLSVAAGERAELEKRLAAEERRAAAARVAADREYFFALHPRDALLALAAALRSALS